MACKRVAIYINLGKNERVIKLWRPGELLQNHVYCIVCDNVVACAWGDDIQRRLYDRVIEDIVRLDDNLLRQYATDVSVINPAVITCMAAKLAKLDMAPIIVEPGVDAAAAIAAAATVFASDQLGLCPPREPKLTIARPTAIKDVEYWVPMAQTAATGVSLPLIFKENRQALKAAQLLARGLLAMPDYMPA